MEIISLEINKEDKLLQFEVRDYAHDDDSRCKFEIYQNERLIASFEPDKRGFLHICKNPGKVEEEVLHLIAEKLETYHF